MKIAVIGGGAAGFFSAIHCVISNPSSSVVIFEKSNKLLSKVRISGGGRCNVTHACFENSLLTGNYPRGQKELRGAFSRFTTTDTVKWFESRGVKLKTEADGRMFPVTDNSQSIIDCLQGEASLHGIKIRTNHAVISIEKSENKFHLHFQNGENETVDKVIIAAGGNPHKKSYEWLEKLGHSIVSPVPSLFTFNVPSSPLKGLEGIAVLHVKIKIADSKTEETGPLLITHWGISGPAVIKLSAWTARWLHEKEYVFNVHINWLPLLTTETVKNELYELKEKEPTKKMLANSFFGLPQRLWTRLCELSSIQEKENCADLSKQKINALTEYLTNTVLNVHGKTTFKDEFVTCGGIDLKEINFQTMESRKVKGVFFAGEVLNIDGVTGGFNFQAAWTTGFLAGMNAGEG